jgi:hypothetical protein
LIQVPLLDLTSKQLSHKRIEKEKKKFTAAKAGFFFIISNSAECDRIER